MVTIQKMTFRINGVTRDDLSKLILDLEKVKVEAVEEESQRKKNFWIKVDAGEVKVSNPFKGVFEYRFDAWLTYEKKVCNAYVIVTMPEGTGTMSFKTVAA
jgi:hypothetical protein